jgi:8-oxo-dGTP diphosphatase
MTVPAVTCAVIIKENKVLITKRSESMRFPLLWEFPGGKAEKDESPESCILREIQEELNIGIKIKRQLALGDDHYHAFGLLLIPFIAEYIGGEIKLTEHSEYQWVFFHELKNYFWVPADVAVVKLITDLFNSQTSIF